MPKFRITAVLHHDNDKSSNNEVIIEVAGISEAVIGAGSGLVEATTEFPLPDDVHKVVTTIEVIPD